jgi:hypothetical protein
MRPPISGTGKLLPRRGTAALLALFCLMVLMAVLAFTVNLEMMASVQLELRCGADAAADAAAATLVSDDLLRGNAALLPALLAQAEQAALQFADANPPAGLTGALQLNPTDQGGGDLLFGTLDHPGATTFQLAGNLTDPTNQALVNINAVQAVPRLMQQRGNAPLLFLGPLLGQSRVEMAASAAVMLDRDVIGFQPVTSQPLPLAPLALLQDLSGTNTLSWSYQVEQQKGTDDFTYNPATKQFSSGPDQLYEFDAVLALDSSQLPAANAALLFIGQTTVAGLIQQLGNGVSAADLTHFGVPLILDATNRLDVTAQAVGPAAGSTDLTNLVAQLNALSASAQARIWPLYTETAGTSATLCGFVAARVVNVSAPVGSGPLSFCLQQTMMSTPAAVTDYTRRGVNSTPIVNPYVCKVRFVQ